MKRLLTFLVLSALGPALFAQWPVDDRFLTFEDTAVLSRIEGGAASLSDRHFREGSKSLRWDYADGEVLSINGNIPFEPQDPTHKDTYLSTFVVWVYCEKPLDGPLTFSFHKDGTLCSSFKMITGFTGWRGAWVCFERDMEGSPREGMDEIRITPPSGSGTLYFDHIITSAKVDSRYQAPDVHTPFVNAATSNHWLLMYAHSLYEPQMPLSPLTVSEKEDMALIESRFRSLLYDPQPLSAARMEKVRKEYAFYDIRYEDGAVKGKPVFMVRQSEAYERFMPGWKKDMFVKMGIELGQFFDVMWDVAKAYSDAAPGKEKDELKGMFLSMYDYITDQGVAGGSAWGYCHHYGYNIRGLYPSYFLMKEVLKEHGKLEEAVKTMQWYAITNEVYPVPEMRGIVIDSFNTHMTGRVASILMMEDSPEKVRYLKSFSRWVDNGCRTAPGLAGSFKPDGACFHHRNNYPAYAVGGLDGAVKAIYYLSGTGFRISEESHRTVCNVLLTMRFFCNKIQWPLGMSGRHPNGSGHLSSDQYGLMAVSGSSDGQSEVDTVMAQAFLRLTPSEKKTSRSELAVAKMLKDAGFAPEKAPEGNMAIGYGCTSIHRRDGWMALVRGHSRYLWATEQYLNANFYGRYLGFGSFEVMAAPAGQEVTLRSSGWMQEGFDWNRIPGVTSIHLPYDQLRAKVYNVDSYSGYEEMLFSDETFAGGLSSSGRNGNFGMILHGHDKYDGSLRARKSYHFVDDVIVCLGTGIECADTLHETETTVFQIAAPDEADKEHWRNADVDGKLFVDRNGTGYCLPAKSSAKASFLRAYPQISVWERKEGSSSGDWVSLVIDHGKAPQGESYEYAVLPCVGQERAERFVKHPSYKVLRQDNDAHIVSFPSKGIYSYILFTGSAEPGAGPVKGADVPCLVMTRSEGRGSMVLSVSQPDLALYDGPADEIYDQDGKRIERSIYSRPWIDNESRPVPVNIRIKGHWSSTDSGISLSADGRDTIVHLECKDAKSYDIKLSRQ